MSLKMEIPKEQRLYVYLICVGMETDVKWRNDQYYNLYFLVYKTGKCSRIKQRFCIIMNISI